MQQSSTTGLYTVEDDSNSGGGTGGIKPRIMIVNNTAEGGTGGYVGLMNGVFAAQKRVSQLKNIFDTSDFRMTTDVPADSVHFNWGYRKHR